MPSLLMAGLAWCFESWRVDAPWGIGKTSLAVMVLSTLLRSCVCLEQMCRLQVCLCLPVPFSRGEHPGSDGKLGVR